MEIIEVSDGKTADAFLDVARIIYKNDKTWVCPLDEDLNAVFTPSGNSFFKHGIAKRWILKSNEGQLIGRIAAFIDYKKANESEHATGGVGFFECINDQEAANLLFDTGKNWLKENNMVAMDGPINFGEPDKFWGCLVDGGIFVEDWGCLFLVALLLPIKSVPATI